MRNEYDAVQKGSTKLELAILRQNGITVILIRFEFDSRKSQGLRSNPRRGIGFEEAQEIFGRPHYLDQSSDFPEQYRAVGWVGNRLFSLTFEVREDDEGEFYHLVTLWKSTRYEEELYAKNT
jgi:uncharacterized DUF497 family protein